MTARSVRSFAGPSGIARPSSSTSRWPSTRNSIAQRYSAGGRKGSPEHGLKRGLSAASVRLGARAQAPAMHPARLSQALVLTAVLALPSGATADAGTTPSETPIVVRVDEH